MTITCGAHNSACECNTKYEKRKERASSNNKKNYNQVGTAATVKAAKVTTISNDEGNGSNKNNK